MLGSKLRNKTVSLIGVFVLLAVLLLGAFSSMMLVGASEPEYMVTFKDFTSGGTAYKFVGTEENAGDYTFSFKYAASAGANGRMTQRVFKDTLSDSGLQVNKWVTFSSDSSFAEGTMSDTFTVVAGSTYYLAMEPRGPASGTAAGKIYFYDMRLVKSGTTDNLYPETLSEYRADANKDYFGAEASGNITVGAYDPAQWNSQGATTTTTAASGTKKMLKMTGTGGNAGFTFKLPNPTVGATYTFSFNYKFEKEGGGLFAPRIYSNTLSVLAARDITTVGSGMAVVSATISSAMDCLYVSVDTRNVADATAVVYMWDVKLVTEGSTENLVANPGFATGDLSGWLNGLTPIAAGVTTAGRFSVVDYDEDLINGNSSSTTTTTIGGATTPKMLEVNGVSAEHGITYKINNPVEGTTYTFSCDYYMPSETSGIALRILGAGAALKSQAVFSPKNKGTATATFTYTRSAAGFGESGEAYLFFGLVRLSNSTQGKVYCWNFKLTASTDPNNNTLSNADFQSGDMRGWLNGISGSLNGTSTVNGISVVDYNEDLLGDTVTTTTTVTATTTTVNSATTTVNSATTTTTSNAGGTTTPKMLEVNGVSSEHGITYKVVPQEENVTYTFSCDYYMPSETSGITLRVLGAGASLKAQGVFQSKAKGTLTVTYTYTRSDAGFSATDTPYLFFGLVRLNNSTQSKVYCWNFKLTASTDPNTNLLPNPDFKSGDLGGWLNGISGSLNGTSTINGISVVDYSDSIFPVPNNTKYMVDFNGFKETAWFYKFVPTEDAKYTFTFTYSVIAGSNGRLFARTYKNGTGIFEDSAVYRTFTPDGTAEPVTETVSITANVKIGNTYYFAVEAKVPSEGESASVGTIYAYDFSLVKEGTTENLYPNTIGAFQMDANADFFRQNGKTLDVVEYDASKWAPGVTAPSTSSTKSKATTTTTKYTGTYPTMPEEDPENMLLMWGRYEDPDTQDVWTHRELGQKVSVEAGKTYIYSFNYYLAPASTAAMGRIYKGNDVSINGIVIQGVMQKRQEGTIQLAFTATEEHEEHGLWIVIAPGGSGFCHVWNMSFVEAGTETEILLNSDFSEGFKHWNVGGTVVSDASVKKVWGQEVVDFDRNIWKDKITTTLAPVEPKDPNTNYQFGGTTTFVYADESVGNADNNNGGGNVSTGNVFGAQGMSALGLLVISAGAMLFILRTVKKQPQK